MPVISALHIAQSPFTFQAFPMDPGFCIEKVADQAKRLPSHSWEFGTASEALLELYNPELSVFGETPFPVPTVNKSDIQALDYACQHITIGDGPNSLSDGTGAVGDPASLGVAAVMLGKTNDEVRAAAARQLEYIINDAPRWDNGAISQRVNVPELWADFVYMAPPFIAYYAADTQDVSMLKLAVDQCGQYRDVLQADLSNDIRYQGVWQHIVGPESADSGLWSTGNAWAAAGMTRVLATVMKAPSALGQPWRQSAIDDLTNWIQQILDGARGAPQDNGLLRNYLSDEDSSSHGFGEISGSSLLAATVYRMAVLRPEVVGDDYVSWAEDIRSTIGWDHITDGGIATPAVNPLSWQDTTPYTDGSPEGNNFVVLMYAAWRDCVEAQHCAAKDGKKEHFNDNPKL